jgi:hypothetical protein
MASKTTNLQKIEAYQAANLISAEIIAADPECYPGLMQELAARVLAGGLDIRRELERRAGLEPVGQAERKGAA